MKILNSEPDNYSNEARDVLLSFAEVIEEKCDSDKLNEMVTDADILIVRLGNMINKEVLDKAHNLKIIVSATTGLNHIDLDYTDSKGIEVLCLKGETEFLENITATAELTWGLLLALYRNIPSAYDHVQNGLWQRDLFRGNQLKNKILGVVGYGRLGKIVAEYGKIFRMTIKVTDPYEDQIPDWIEKVELDELLKTSDVVTLHVPLNQSTENLIDENKFKLFKQGSALINTSRGELIDEEALLEMLESGYLKGAALDVLRDEIDNSFAWMKNNPLVEYASKNNNLIIVPHIGGATLESMHDAEIFMANKLRKYLEANNLI